MTTFKSRRENQNQKKNLKIRSSHELTKEVRLQKTDMNLFSHDLKDPSLTDHTVGRYLGVVHKLRLQEEVQCYSYFYPPH